MSIPREKKEELASAYLDGALEMDVRIEVERILREDSEFATILADLNSIREAIRLIPPQKLTDDFAARVVQAARRDSAQLGPKAPHWINPPEKRHQAVQSETVHPAESVSERWQRRSWGKYLAIAAALLLVLSTTFYFYRGNNGNSADKMAFIADANQPTGESRTNDSEGNSPDTGSRIAHSDASSTAANANTSLGESSSSTVASPSIAHVDLERQANGNAEIHGKMEPANDRVASMDSFPQTDVPAFRFDELMLLVDISASDEALSGNFLEQILERHQIAFDSPLSVGEDVHNALKANRFVGSESGDRTESVTVVFVKSRGSRLDAALAEIFKFYEDFPEIAFDLISDPPAPAGLQLLRSLREFSEADFDQPDSPYAGLARPLQLSREAFVAPSRRPSVPPEVRAQGFPALTTAIDMDPVTYGVIVIRHAAK